MKTVKEFVDSMVKVEFVESSNCFGHYPFQIFVETKDGELEIDVLALGGDVVSCYKTFFKHKRSDAKRIYLSLDFPSGGDIDNDFVAIFSFENNEFKLYAIPYLLSDGSLLPEIYESDQLKKILSEFKRFD